MTFRGPFPPLCAVSLALGLGLCVDALLWQQWVGAFVTSISTSATSLSPTPQLALVAPQMESLGPHHPS